MEAGRGWQAGTARIRSQLLYVGQKSRAAPPRKCVGDMELLVDMDCR